MSSQHGSHRQKGFSLIELLIAILVVSVGLLATMSMLITDVRVNQSSEHRIDSSGIAQSVLQQAIAQASYVSNNYASNTFSVVNIPGGQATVTVSPSPATTVGLTHLRVVLSWQEHGVTKQVELRGRAVTR